MLLGLDSLTPAEQIKYSSIIADYWKREAERAKNKIELRTGCNSLSKSLDDLSSSLAKLQKAGSKLEESGARLNDAVNELYLRITPKKDFYSA